MGDLRDEIVTDFHEVFAREPDGVWSAPGVLEIAPGRRIAADRRAFVALAAREDRMLRIASLADDELLEIDMAAIDDIQPLGWSAAPIAALRQIARLGADLAAVPGVDVLIENTVDDGLAPRVASAAAFGLALSEAWRVDAPSAMPAILHGQARHAITDDGVLVSLGEGDEILFVPTADVSLAVGAVHEIGARSVHGVPTGVVVTVAADDVSRVLVAIDGAFAEHGLGQPPVLVVRASHGARRDR